MKTKIIRLVGCALGMGSVCAYGAAPEVTDWTLNEDGREILLSFNGALSDVATNATAWTISGGTIVSARFFQNNEGLALHLAQPLDTRNTHTLTGTVGSGAVALSLRRPKPDGLPARLVYGAVERDAPASRRSPVFVTEVLAAPPTRSDGRDMRFVEIYNSNPYTEQIGGFTLSGSISHAFPAGTTLAAHARVVVAANAADVRSVYGIANVVQADSAESFALPCDLVLRDEQGAVLGELEIVDDVPWPAGIAGGGHSLVLARPSYGWTNPDGWSRSALAGGSPGQPDPARPTDYEGVLVNEVLSHGGDAEGYVELYDTAAVARPLGGCTVEIRGSSAVYTIGENEAIAPHLTYALGEGKLGFPIGGEGIEVWLRAPAAKGGYLIDALRVPPVECGRSYGRWPDGGPLASRLESPTRNARNLPRAASEIVLNEIMYNPMGGEKDHEYVEVLNRTGADVVLKGWTLAGAVTYEFKKKDIAAAEGTLVVPRDLTAFTNLYPDVTAIASKSYSGSLPNSRGLVRLCREMTVWSAAEGAEVLAAVPMEEVEYRDGGAWGRWSDGGGSSLERVDPRADARLPGSWADSDESGSSDWTTISCTAKLQLGMCYKTYGLQEDVEFGIYDAGECLVDDVTLKAENGANLVVDPSFENDNAGGTWKFYGTHRRCTIEQGVAENGGAALHLRACDRLHNGGNCVHGRLSTALATNGTATISARVKWLAGSPDFVIKSKGNWIEACGSIVTTRALGTPGRANGRAAPAAPCIAEVTHLPILPRGGEAVSVWARAEAPDGVAAMALLWATDGAATSNRVAMSRADGGWWRGEIPGQASGRLVAFHVEAVDAGAVPRVAFGPVGGGALVRFGEAETSHAFNDYRLWVTAAEVLDWKNQIYDSNEPHTSTFVLGGERVVYGTGAEYGGSNWHANNSNKGVAPGTASNNLDYKVTFPKDALFHGDDSIVLAVPGNDANDPTCVREQFAYALLRRTGRPFMNRQFVHVYFNGALQNRFGIHEDTEKPGGDAMDHWYPDGGSLFKMCGWCEYSATDLTDYAADEGVTLDDRQYRATDASGNRVYPTSRLRWNFQPRAYKAFEPNDFDGPRALLAAVNAAPTLSDAELDRVLPAAAYARTIAVEHYVGNWDGYGNNGGNGKNMYFCQSARGWEFIAWDIDFSFGNSLSLTETLTPASFPGVKDPMLKPLLARPLYLRRYWQAVKRCAEATRAGAAEFDVLQEKYAALQSDGVPVSALSTLKANMETRRAYAAGKVDANDVSAFALESPAGSSVQVPTNVVTLTGRAPLVVEEIRANGVPLEVVWTSATAWSASLTLTAATTPVSVTAHAADGSTLASASFTVTGVIPSEPPPTVAINEFMAQNSLFINDYTGGYDDWFELCNYGTEAVSLAGWIVTDTLVSENPPVPSPKTSKALVFPAGLTLQPGAVLLVWTGGVDDACPDATPPQAPFGLGKSEDRIYLFDARTNLVDQVGYDTTQSATSSMGRVPNGTGELTTLQSPTPGAVNQSDPSPALTSARPVEMHGSGGGALAVASPAEVCGSGGGALAVASPAEVCGSGGGALAVASSAMTMGGLPTRAITLKSSQEAFRDREGFESAAALSVATNLPYFRADGDGILTIDDEESSQVRLHDAFAPTAACGEPDVFKALSNTHYLHYNTQNGEGHLWRSMGEFAGSAAGELYIDLMVQLDVWDEGSTPELMMAPGQRVQLWAQADGKGNTNICVAALLYDDDGWDTWVSTNVFRMANVSDLGPDTWHRLTLRAIDDVTRAHQRNPDWYPDGVQGFLIWFDGVLLRAEGESSFTDGFVDFLAFDPDPAWGWLLPGDPADEAVADLLYSGTVFADLRGPGFSGMEDLGFCGTGGADDLTVTSSEPDGFRSDRFDVLLLSESNALFHDDPSAALFAWLDSVGVPASVASGDAYAHDSYLLNVGLGLDAAPRLTITAIEPCAPDAWDVTVRLTTRREGGEETALALQDGTRPTLNGTLLVQTATTLEALDASEARAFPFVFPSDRTTLTVRVPAEEGCFFRARLQ